MHRRRVRVGPDPYGEFHYATAKDARDRHGWLPPQAVDITYHAFASGHQARFTIDEEDLLEWLRSFPSPAGERLPSSAPEAVAEDFNLHFGERGWTPPRDAKEIVGPRAANSAGFSIWYSPSERVAYLSAGYW